VTDAVKRFFLLLPVLLILIGCTDVVSDSGSPAYPGEPVVYPWTGYGTIYETQAIKYYQLPETVNSSFALLASGSHVDIWWDVSLIPEWPIDDFLRERLYIFDNDYEDITDFYGLYERGGNQRIQIYVFDLTEKTGAGGRAVVSGDYEEAILMNINSLTSRTFSHELGHLISFANNYGRSSYFGFPWYVEFLAIMTEFVTGDLYYTDYDYSIELFTWVSVGIDNRYYNNHRIFACYLYETYGVYFFYELMYMTLDNSIYGRDAIKFVLYQHGVPNDYEVDMIIIDGFFEWLAAWTYM
jgi:hypothetical protein